MGLDKIRKDIDALDTKIAELLMQRLDYAEQVVQTKIDDGVTNIYLAEREDDIMENILKNIPEERKDTSRALMRKIVEISRTHQFNILNQQVPGLLDEYLEDVEIPEEPTRIRFEAIRPNIEGQMGVICTLIGDAHFNIQEVQQMDNSVDNASSRLWFTVDGDIYDPKMKTLLIQLAQESEGFSILSID
ncbi:MAG: chorismate mutase [Eubacterium sp.]|nr:chorismate mutase [Candidatus Colimonas fimequi]